MGSALVIKLVISGLASLGVFSILGCFLKKTRLKKKARQFEKKEKKKESENQALRTEVESLKKQEKEREEEIERYSALRAELLREREEKKAMLKGKEAYINNYYLKKTVEEFSKEDEDFKQAFKERNFVKTQEKEL